MGKREDIAGFNTRFDSHRNKGFAGAQGYNVYPREDEESWAAADPAGNYDSAESFLSGTEIAQISVEVTEVFNNTPTLTVGTTADPDQFVTLADAVDLTSLGTTIVAVPLDSNTLAADSVLRAVIGGTPDQGAATLTADLVV